MIYVYTLAINEIYNSFIEAQLNSIHNLFPDKQKTFIILSDITYDVNKLTEKYNFNQHNINLLSYIVPNISFSINCLLKTYYMQLYLPKECTNNDLILFFDADTIYLEKGKIFYDDLYQKFLEYDLILCKHSLEKDYQYWMNDEHNRIEINKASYINNVKTNYVQTSFFGLKKQSLYKINIDITNLLNEDQTPEIKYLGHFQDETYINKIQCDSLDYKIYKDYFNDIYTMHNYVDRPNIFCLQKYNIDEKSKYKRKINILK